MSSSRAKGLTAVKNSGIRPVGSQRRSGLFEERLVPAGIWTPDREARSLLTIPTRLYQLLRKESSHFTCYGQTISVAIYINIYLHFWTQLTLITRVKYFVRFKFRVLQTEIWCPKQFVSSTYPSKGAKTERNSNCASCVVLLYGRRRIFCYKHIL